VKAAMGLAKLGLLREALAELASLDTDGLTGAEMATIIQVEAAAGDFLVAHDRLRTWLQTRPPDSLGPNAWRVMRVAYPNQYWPEVQAAASYGWDPRVFHALVREESNFNPNIKSHAGACGLSQLMPGTAKGCAKRMGLAFASGQIWDPAVNLKIGAWYLDTLHARYHGNSMLALAGYNAGEGNADRWVAGMPPNAPSDAVIESIDFRETRHYVKRVLSTYQTYRLLYGTADLFPAWVAVMDDAVP
jgi:soluble lytic murein transglycosylase